MPATVFTSDASGVLMVMADYALNRPGEFFTKQDILTRTYLVPSQVDDGLTVLLTRGLIEEYPPSEPPAYRLADHGVGEPDYL